MGWVGFVTFGALYWLIPKLWAKRGMYSERLISWHFWIATLGIVLYITAMWVSGILQGLMWRAYDENGFLQYAFIETVAAMYPYYVIRVMGGVLYLAGALIMVWNVWMTVTRGEQEEAVASPAPAAAVTAAAE
jgi:cytochrome c oxidase cbb3-type subunit 1